MISSQSQQFWTISASPHELLTIYLLSGMLLGRLSGRQTLFKAALVSCTFQTSNTSSASSDTAQTGSLTSFSTCFRLTASFLHTSLLSTGNSFELESLKRRLKRLPLNVTRTSGQILLLGWASTCLNNLGF